MKNIYCNIKNKWYELNILMFDNTWVNDVSISVILEETSEKVDTVNLTILDHSQVNYIFFQCHPSSTSSSLPHTVLPTAKNYMTSWLPPYLRQSAGIDSTFSFCFLFPPHFLTSFWSQRLMNNLTKWLTRQFLQLVWKELSLSWQTMSKKKNSAFVLHWSHSKLPTSVASM